MAHFFCYMHISFVIKSIYCIKNNLLMGENRKYLKLPRIDSVFDNKEIAINSIKEYVIDNVLFFHDGESILVRFKNEYNEIVSSHVTININNENEVSLSFGLDSTETINIVDTETPPTDINSLWLSEEDVREEEDKDNIITGLKQRIESLEKVIASMSSLVDKHEYALTHTISGGDFLTNSVKYDLENSIVQEKPAAAKYGEVYSATNKIAVTFELCIGETNLHEFSDIKLYTNEYYYIKPKFYNNEGVLINPNEIKYTLISSNNSSVETKFVEASKRWYIYGLKKDNVIITCTVENEDETVLIDDFILIFEEESEPYKYEPNVKHVLMKTAETFDILSANTKYLLLNEFVWCKGNNSLYFKAEASNGSINLFKINGGGAPGPDIPDTPDTPDIPDEPSTGTTSDIEINVDNNDILNLSDNTEEKNLKVDENGILNIPKEVAYVDENGILVFKQKTDDNGVDIEFDENTEELSIKGDITLDNDILTIVGTIDENGTLILNGTQPSININGETLEVNSEIDEEGYLTLTNVEIDEEGYIIIK